ncbi:MAG: SCP2 sterol-binding domain-containing protein [Gemmatimonadaceae bacterium]|nr:SCP2 sterol-binding domain-containing protein [Gemmatimonadaceae bacterium]
MPIPAFSPAWADALRDAVNSDEAFREAGRKWTNPVALIVTAHAARPDGVAVQVDLEAGTCTAAAALRPDDVTAPFVLSASLETWREIMEGETDPIAAVSRGRVAVTRGSLSLLMLSAGTARALLASTRKIDTLWPGSQPE